MSDATHWRLLRFRQNSCLLTRHRSARSSSGIIGVLVTLVLTGTTVNVMSLMGVVMLAGIAMSNSILIVEFAHHRRSEGKSVAEAIIESCQVRRRPILMTSLATILGLLPMALKFGEGSESMRSWRVRSPEVYWFLLR
ncbi:MAG TPA: efflux RND transporter permease subunit [Terracidiphilus sp.]|nr:efflux RND transporter permease subunit [Terracidiphilus sp.]